MSKQIILRGMLIVIVMLALASPVFAGGWAVVTLDELPEGALANVPLNVGFMIRQHGQTAWQSDQVRVYATNLETDQTVSVRAIEKGKPGHYVATLVLPSAGTWDWAVKSGLMPQFQAMPALNVFDMPAGGFKTLPLVVWTGDIRLAPASHAAQLGRLLPVVPAAQHGLDLFWAKGCVVCHTHAAVDQDEVGLSDFTFGPNLTNLNRDSKYLHNWLEDPSAMKPGTDMPTLGLREAEIDALVSFLMPAAAGQ